MFGHSPLTQKEHTTQKKRTFCFFLILLYLVFFLSLIIKSCPGSAAVLSLSLSLSRQANYRELIFATRWTFRGSHGAASLLLFFFRPSSSSVCASPHPTPVFLPSMSALLLSLKQMPTFWPYRWRVNFLALSLSINNAAMIYSTTLERIELPFQTKAKQIFTNDLHLSSGLLFINLIC